MLTLVTYDVSTETKQGRRRLRRVALVCQDYGQRVQKSVFECKLGETELVVMRKRLLAEIDNTEDSLRIYHIDDASASKTEHYGLGKPIDFEEPLIV